MSLTFSKYPYPCFYCELYLEHCNVTSNFMLFHASIRMVIFPATFLTGQKSEFKFFINITVF